MPNHVTTRCIVTGDNSEIKRFRDLMFDTYADDEGNQQFWFNFEKIIPPPKEVIKSAEDKEPGLSPLWYSWNCKNWGTKWNSYSFKLINDEPLDFSFETAWSPPFPVLEAIAKEFPRLQFECYSFDEGWIYGCEGYYNLPQVVHTFKECKATKELYEKVYNQKYMDEEE